LKRAEPDESVVCRSRWTLRLCARFYEARRRAQHRAREHSVERTLQFQSSIRQDKINSSCQPGRKARRRRARFRMNHTGWTTQTNVMRRTRNAVLWSCDCVILDFHHSRKPYPNQVFTIVIWGSYQAEIRQFGRKVSRSARVRDGNDGHYVRGAPELVAHDPSQIKV